MTILGAELLERALDDFAQLLHRIGPRLDLSSLTHDLGIPASKEGAVKHIEQGVLQKIVAGDKVDYSGALVENQEDSGEGRNRAIDEEENGELRLGEILLAGKKTVSFVDKKQIIHVPALQDLLGFLVHGIDNSVARGGLLLVISPRRCSCIGHGDGDGERK
ncbi:hypothetical protein HG530_002412 [Fusarium avenaceum]|nr:hypothetical protein HG530_002412 [Fusarium avenaceum]